MSEEKLFPLGVILSVMHRRMLAPGGFPSITLLLAYLLEGPDFIGEITINDRTWWECAQELKRQLPHLIDALSCGSRCGTFSETTTRDWAQVDALEQRYGPEHPVRQMAGKA